MQLDRKVLAFGQLPSSKGDLYVPASGRKGFVHNVTLHNANTTSEDVVLNYHDGSSEHQILSETIPAGDSLYLDFPGEGDVVDDGGKLTGNTDTASKVTYKFSGTEEIATPVDDRFVRGAVSTLWMPPAVPHAQDDEFDSDVLDSAWNVYQGWSPTLGSFSYGTIDAYDTGFTSGTVLRVDVNDARPSWMLMQQPATGSSTEFFRLTKAYTLPTNVLIWSRLKFNQPTLSAINDDITIGLMINHDNGGLPDQNNSVEMFLNESDSGVVQSKFWRRVGGSTTLTGSSNDVDAQGQALEYVAIHKIGTTYHGWVGTNAGNWIWLNSATVSGTFAHVGWFMSQYRNASPGPSITGVDFIRFKETDKFLL